MASQSFAVVAEGATDHAIIENIIIGICKTHNIELESINPVQPLVDATGKQLIESHGGWHKVLNG